MNQTQINAQVSETRTRSRPHLRAALLVLGTGFAIGYTLQICTPLRLCTDTITLLEMAASAHDGHGFPRTQFPIGYPAIVVALEATGLATSSGLVCVNLLAIAVALAAFYGIFTRRLNLSSNVAALICILSTTSWVLIKHVTLPLTDIPYLGVSVVALLLMVISETEQGQRKAAAIVGAAICCALAITIRTVGIALLPALIWVAGGRMSLMWIAERRRLLAGLATITAVSTIVGSRQLMSTVYFEQLTSALQRKNVIGMFAENIGWRLREFGEMTLNLPQSQIPPALQGLFTVVGAAALTALMLGIWSRKSVIGATEVYLAAYTALIFVWPFYDTRFWIPVIPLLMVFVWNGARGAAQRWTRFHNTTLTPVFGTSVAWFLLWGVIALVYSSRLTFSGESFAERYGDGTLADTYRSALGQRYDPPKVRPSALRLLKRYGSRDRQAVGS